MSQILIKSIYSPECEIKVSSSDTNHPGKILMHGEWKAIKDGVLIPKGSEIWPVKDVVLPSESDLSFIESINQTPTGYGVGVQSRYSSTRGLHEVTFSVSEWIDEAIVFYPPRNRQSYGDMNLSIAITKTKTPQGRNRGPILTLPWVRMVSPEFLYVTDDAGTLKLGGPSLKPGSTITFFPKNGVTSLNLESSGTLPNINFSTTTPWVYHIPSNTPDGNYKFGTPTKLDIHVLTGGAERAEMNVYSPSDLRPVLTLPKNVGLGICNQYNATVKMGLDKFENCKGLPVPRFHGTGLRHITVKPGSGANSSGGNPGGQQLVGGGSVDIDIIDPF